MKSSTTSYELTDLQKQIWYGCLRFADPGAFTLSVCIRLVDVDVEAVREAIDRVVHSDRLLALRVVGTLEEPALAAVADPRSLHSYRDVRGVGLEGLDRLFHERRSISLDPAVATFDSLLARTGDRELRWFIALHHIVADGWSVKVLVERVARCCELGPGWLPPENSFETFLAEWKEYRQSPAHADDERFWNERGAAPHRAVEFYGRRATREPKTVRISSVLKPETTRGVRRTAESNAASASSPNVAVANFYAAALFTYLHLISGENKLSIGMPFSNRRTPRERESLGLHMQVGMLRVEVDPREPFHTLLARVARESEAVNRHRRLTPGNAENRVFEVMLNVHNVTYPRVAGGTVSEQWLRSGNDTLPFTLHVRGIEAERTLLELDLQEGTFPVELRSRVANQFVRILDQAASDPDRVIDEFELEQPLPLPAPPTTDARDEGATIHELFARAADASAEKTAVIWDGTSVSFAEIDARSEEICARLVALGCPPGGVVGISMERSIGAVASILGVLRAGGVWLPLDPSYPERLLEFMVSDADARMAIRASHGPRLHGVEAAIPVLDVDARSGAVVSVEGRRPESAGTDAPATLRSSTRPAFCLYTSGSTGQPKGVVGSHASALNRLQWMWRAHPFEEDEVVLQKTSLNFIDSVWEIFGPLLAGRPILVADDTTVRDPVALAGLVGRYPVRRIILVPTLLRALLATPDGLPIELRGVRRWFVTGELFPSNLARELLEEHPGAEVYNLYGTTETYDAACHRVTEADFDRPFIPIGQPIDNMQLLVVDDRLRLVPKGIRGELCVRGAGVAYGYLNRPDLTARKFPPAEGAAPLFRSGDSARVLPDGNIEIIGRLDNQIKLRGYRIELEEVEHQLLELPGVGDALALVDGVPPGEELDARLIAYLTPARGVQLRPRHVEGLLRERLPPWMIPSIMIVPTLPTTPSGKHARTPTHYVPNGRRAAPRRALLARVRPRDWNEERLRAIWRRVLEVDEIGEHDNFFDIGGNSLLAVRVAAEIERELGVRLPLASLFEAPTLRQLVDRHIRGARAVAQSPVAVRRGAPGRIPLFSVPPAGSTVSVFGALARYLPPEQPLYSFQPKGLERGENPHRSIEEMARDYLREMKAVQPQGPYLLSGRCFGGYVAYEMAQLLTARGERVAALIIIDSPEAPLEAHHQRSHVGVRKLLRYYPKRIRYFVQRGMLLATMRMKIRNDLSYLAARLVDRIPAPKLDSRERRLRMLRHLHTLAYHRYVAQPYEGRITMLSAGETMDLTEERTKWENVSRGGIDWYTIPGRHHDLMKEPNIQQVAARITECLGEVDLDNKDRTRP